MIFISSPTEDKELSKEDLLLLQKACHKMAVGLKERVYDMQVYYKAAYMDAPNSVMEQMKSEIEQYQKLRIIFEDLEGL